MGQQGWYVNIQGARQRFQGAQSHIPLPALHRSHIGSMQAALVGQFLLW